MSAAHDHPSLSLTDVHRREIADAHARLRPIRRAVSVARFSASTSALFAAITLLFAPLFGVVNLVIGGGLAVIAWNEFVGAGMLGRLDAGAPLRLAARQIALGSIVAGYCLCPPWRVLAGDAAGGSPHPQFPVLPGHNSTATPGPRAPRGGCIPRRRSQRGAQGRPRTRPVRRALRG